TIGELKRRRVGRLRHIQQIAVRQTEVRAGLRQELKHTHGARRIRRLNVQVLRLDERDVESNQRRNATSLEDSDQSRSDSLSTLEDKVSIALTQLIAAVV